MEDSVSIFPVLLILVWLGLAAGTAVIAKMRGRQPVPWFGIAVLGSPVMGMLFLLALPILPDPATDEREECSRCCERIMRSAKACPFCGIERNPYIPKEIF
jgi:hypothetical protein